MMKLQQEELTYKLRGGLFSVHNEVGLGRSEEAYHRAFCMWMSENRISFETKPVYALNFKGKKILDLIPDLVIEDALIIELKSKTHKLVSADCVQLYNYLKRTGLNLGLLVNMGSNRVHIERHFHDKIQTECRISDHDHSDNATTGRLYELLVDIYAAHTTGYSSSIMDRLLKSALLQERFKFTQNPTTPDFYKDHNLGKSSLDCLVIDEEVVVCHTCLYQDNDFNLSRAYSFLKALKLEQGLTVNFGKNMMDAKFL